MMRKTIMISCKKRPEPDLDVSPVEALDLLIEDWGAFMKGDIWDAQDEAP